ncbi:MAG: hypothetical protein AAGD13_00890 [Pseudomonadota bacterium]
MTQKADIVATAAQDAPEFLDTDDLESLSAGAYGGHNSCEPYGGDNTCEPPGAGRAEFQTLPIERPDRAVKSARGLTAR